MQLEVFTSLSIEQKVGQLFFIGIPGPEIDSATLNLLEYISPGGICLFARNIREAGQTRSLLDSLREVLPVEPFLSLDQEGGIVDRLKRILPPMPPASKISTAEDAHELGWIIGTAVMVLGFNMDFAPVVDVIDETRSKFSNGLYSRAFGNSANEVADLAGAFLGGLQANGCIGCIKHFPGLGASEVDSHEELPLVNSDRAEIEGTDLEPYRSLFATRNVHAVMVAHAAYPRFHLQEADQSGKLLPSSLSFNIVTKLLRQELGFTGLVLTDDLEMGAVVNNYGIGEACVLAILAGEDMVSICAGVDAIHEGFAAVIEAVRTGRIEEERIDQSLVRIAAAKSKLDAPLNFDPELMYSLSNRITALNDRLN